MEGTRKGSKDSLVHRESQSPHKMLHFKELELEHVLQQKKRERFLNSKRSQNEYRLLKKVSSRMQAEDVGLQNIRNHSLLTVMLQKDRIAQPEDLSVDYYTLDKPYFLNELRKREIKYRETPKEQYSLALRQVFRGLGHESSLEGHVAEPSPVARSSKRSLGRQLRQIKERFYLGRSKDFSVSDQSISLISSQFTLPQIQPATTIGTDTGRGTGTSLQRSLLQGASQSKVIEIRDERRRQGHESVPLLSQLSKLPVGSINRISLRAQLPTEGRDLSPNSQSPELHLSEFRPEHFVNVLKREFANPLGKPPEQSSAKRLKKKAKVPPPSSTQQRASVINLSDQSFLFNSKLTVEAKVEARVEANGEARVEANGEAKVGANIGAKILSAKRSKLQIL